MKISYAITVCNEYEEIIKLVELLVTHKRIDDEIVILFDSNNGTQKVLDYISEKKDLENYSIYSAKFNNHFSYWKNLLTSYCTGDYIFQIDADEFITKEFIDILPKLIKVNSNSEVMLVPRINTVEGLTDQHINKWGWIVNEKNWVNFPDYQYRIWKNIDSIRWKNKVHEVLSGYKTFVTLPPSELFCLLHPKKIEKQEKQNTLYDEIQIKS